MRGGGKKLTIVDLERTDPVVVVLVIVVLAHEARRLRRGGGRLLPSSSSAIDPLRPELDPGQRPESERRPLGLARRPPPLLFLLLLLGRRPTSAGGAGTLLLPASPRPARLRRRCRSPAPAPAPAPGSASATGPSGGAFEVAEVGLGEGDDVERPAAEGPDGQQRPADERLVPGRAGRGERAAGGERQVPALPAGRGGGSPRGQWEGRWRAGRGEDGRGREGRTRGAARPIRTGRSRPRREAAPGRGRGGGGSVSERSGESLSAPWWDDRPGGRPAWRGSRR